MFIYVCIYLYCYAYYPLFIRGYIYRYMVLYICIVFYVCICLYMIEYTCKYSFIYIWG